MVKGVSKRVVVVKTPDTRFFEQAIFMMKEDALSQKGVSPQRLLDEACRVADSYVHSARAARRRLAGPVWALLGGLAVGAVWALTALFA